VNTASASFAAASSLDLSAEGIAGTSGFDSGTVTLNGYEVLLSETAATSSVPEPASVGLFGAAILAFAAFRRRRRAPAVSPE
jgi:hypothetical protein